MRFLSIYSAGYWSNEFGLPQSASLMISLLVGMTTSSFTNKALGLTNNGTDVVEDMFDDIGDYVNPRSTKNVLGNADDIVNNKSARNVLSDNDCLVNRDVFRKNEDPLRDVLGPGTQSHPEQWNEIINNMEEAGVEIIYRSDGLAYSPANCGHSGQIIIDTDTSYGALLHEYTHYLDDMNAGFPGMEYQFQTINRARMELHAYMQEIKLADSLGYKEVARQLFENYRIERTRIAGYLK